MPSAGKPLVAGHLDVCICVSLIPEFIKANVVAQTAVNLLGVAKVTALIEALVRLPTETYLTPKPNNQFTSIFRLTTILVANIVLSLLTLTPSAPPPGPVNSNATTATLPTPTPATPTRPPAPAPHPCPSVTANAETTLTDAGQLFLILRRGGADTFRLAQRGDKW